MLFSLLLLHIELLQTQITKQDLQLELSNQILENISGQLYINDLKTQELELLPGSNQIQIPLSELTLPIKSMSLVGSEQIFPLHTDPKPPSCLLQPIALINEINLEEDFIEIYLNDTSLQEFIFLEIDNKQIPTQGTPGLITIEYNLPRSTEQISLKFLDQTLDGICYTNTPVVASEQQANLDFQSQHQTACFAINLLPKNHSLSRNNLNKGISLNNYTISTRSSKNSFQIHQNLAPQAIIKVQEEKSDFIQLSAQDSLDPDQHQLSYQWVLEDKIISTNSEVKIPKNQCKNKELF